MITYIYKVKFKCRRDCFDIPKNIWSDMNNVQSQYTAYICMTGAFLIYPANHHTAQCNTKYFVYIGRDLWEL